MNDSSIQFIEPCEKANNIPTSKKNNVIAYKECLKNHAAALGSHSIDGCGEYMPSSGDNALLCMACGCHRNFHRKVVGVGVTTSHTFHQLAEFHHYRCNTSTILENKIPKGPQDEGGRVDSGPQKVTISQNERHVITLSEYDGGQITEEGVIMNNKKRYRTKFTKEQKEKMFGFGEKLGWKIQKSNEELVQQFCKEIGIERKVLKVWMHNNKHLFVKNNTQFYS